MSLDQHDKHAFEHSASYPTLFTGIITRRVQQHCICVMLHIYVVSGPRRESYRCIPSDPAYHLSATPQNSSSKTLSMCDHNSTSCTSGSCRASSQRGQQIHVRTASHRCSSVLCAQPSPTLSFARSKVFDSQEAQADMRFAELLDGENKILVISAVAPGSTGEKVCSKAQLMSCMW